MTTPPLTGVIAANIQATNAHDLDAIVGTFADGAFITDAGREFHGTDAIRGFVSKEIVRDAVTYTPVEVTEHHGLTVVRPITDGQFDKSKLPDPFILTHYFRVAEGKITSQITVLVKNRDS